MKKLLPISFVLVILAVTACTSPSPDVDDNPVDDPIDKQLGPAALVCDLTEEELASDPLNCGTCGNVCVSGICNFGECGDYHAGHVFVIGHNYLASNKALDRILANAVATQRDQVLDVLIYRGTNTQALAWATHDALVRGANQLTRAVRRTFTPASSNMGSQLPNYDVLIVSPQPQMTDAQLDSVANEFALPVDDFVRAGGTVVVLDAPSTTNTGTVRVLGNIMPVTRSTTTPGATASITSYSDASAASIPFSIAINAGSVGYAPSTFDTVMTSASGDAFVVHRAVF